jgi:uncharacterized paraquat-inducible protein A
MGRAPVRLLAQTSAGAHLEAHRHIPFSWRVVAPNEPVRSCRAARFAEPRGIDGEPGETMSLVPCRACDGEVAIDAAACPRCGVELVPSPRLNAIWILALAGIGVSISGILIPLLL